LESVEKGLQKSYAALAAEYKARIGEELCELSAIGISAMMHGYLAFDGEGELLVPFRTWRNTNTEKAADELTELFGFNIPMRWSVAHYYQAVLDNEAHVKKVKFLTTLAGYVHYRLTGKRVLGIGDASGMFPVSGSGYDKEMLAKFDALLAGKGIDTPFEELLPEVLLAADNAGVLTEEGARYLDATGKLKAGCMLCPPEGDAGTGMVATCSITPRTANISAGTSAFLMVVLERKLRECYREIDVVSTPHGMPVAMVHVNNFTSEITAWTNLFEEVIALGGGSIDRGRLFDALYARSLEGEEDCGGIMGYNFLSGEPIAGVEQGIPLIARASDGRLTLANFMKMHIFSALGTLAIGCKMLERENVRIDSVCGHGGFFKAPLAGQSAMSAAIGTPITVMRNAGEGGAWGMALLALAAYSGVKELEPFVENIFASAERNTVSATEEQIRSFDRFMEKYKSGLAVEKLAAKVLY
ncbi:MAG: ATPase, partial [Clostridia bacterium]|nr:ATPase [Clostridia bacterium]